MTAHTHTDPTLAPRPPRQPLTLSDALQSSATSGHGITYILASSEERHLSYADLFARARRWLGLLQDRGVRQGDELLIVTDDQELFTAVFWACILGRIAAVPVSPPVNDDGAIKILNVLDILNRPWLLSDQALDSKLASMAGEPGTLALARIAGRTILAPGAAVLDSEAGRRLADPVAVNSDDISLIQFSSGSTGAPKGVTLTHANLIANASAIMAHLGAVGRAGRLLNWMPLTHDFGIIWFHIMPTIFALEQAQIPTKLFIRNPLLWMQKASDFRATILGGANYSYRYLLKHLNPDVTRDWDLSGVRVMVNGAEPIDCALIGEFQLALAPYGLSTKAIMPGYGLAEGTVCVSMTPVGAGLHADPVDRRTVSPGQRVQLNNDHNSLERIVFADVGTPVATVGVRIADTDGHPYPDGVVGTIQISGPSVMHGYYNNPEATRAVLSADGWLDTGDLGYQRSGRLVITGRRKDVIIVNGANYYPQDIERVAAEVPGFDLNMVLACAVPLPAEGREGLALCVLYRKSLESFVPLAEQIRDRVVQKIGIAVDHCLIVPQIPKTTSGKVRRFQVVERFNAGAFDEQIATLQRLSVERGAALRDAWISGDRVALLAALRSEAARVAPSISSAGSLDAEKPLLESGFNSLRLVEFLNRLNRALGLTLPISLLFDQPTLSGLTDHLLRLQQVATSEAPMTIETAQVETLVPTASDKAIAVIGIGCRFPGDADTPDAFWDLLLHGVDATGPFPSDRWPAALNAAATTDRGAYLSHLDRFDARFFNLTPVEAEALDPQQRLLLTVSWDAFEHAGIDPQRLKGPRTGVFTGISGSDYSQAQARSGDLADIGAYAFTGTAASIASGRLSYFYGFEGPNLAVDTACSSSLTAVHLAVRALRTGDCDTALASGVNLILSPELQVGLSRMNALSPDGRCKSFAAEANGYARGEGCAAVVLKRLADAKRDGDRVLAVIRGSAMNHDGASNGLTAPSGAAQQAVVRAALADAGVCANAIDYVEAHGTGTALGDPVEVMALAAVQGDSRLPERPLLIGSVKSNIAHLEAAAGIAALCKTVLALERGTLPASLHAQTLNPMIPWAAIPVAVTTDSRPWPPTPGNRPRRAGVSAFGLSGTNIHLIVEAAPAEAPTELPCESPSALTLLPLSARTEADLVALAQRYGAALRGGQCLSDLAYTAAFGRTTFPYRLSVAGRDADALSTRLAAVVTAPRKTATTAPRIVFAFSGQGSQVAGAGRDLFAHEPVFRDSLRRSERCLGNQLGRPLTTLMFDGTPKELARTAITQPVVVAFGLALADLLRSWGITPAAVLGHSVGEIAAAAVAGVCDADTALLLAARRGVLMEALPAGAMAAVACDVATAEAALAKAGGIVTIAAVNGPDSLTLSGETAAVERAMAILRAQGVRVSRLEVSRAFHSPLMDPMLTKLEVMASSLHLCDPHLPLHSTVSGRLASPGLLSNPAYWARHARAAVLFHDALQSVALDSTTLFIELGARPSLAPLVAASLPEATWLACSGGPDPELRLNETLGRLFELGAPVSWPGVFATRPGRRTTAPNYPFRGQTLVLPTVRRAVTSIAADAAPLAVAPVILAAVAAVPPRRAGIADTIRNILRGIAGLDPAEIEPASSWFSLGLDSLLIVQLQQALCREYGIAMTLVEVFEQGNSLDALTALVASRLANAPLDDPDHSPDNSPAPATIAPAPEIKGLFKKLPGKRAGWTNAQRDHVRCLAADYNARTHGSKEHTAHHREVYANPRAVIGYRPEWKELTYPLHVARADGAYVWDVDGNRYVDITMGFGVTLLGHNPPFIHAAIAAELAAGAPLGPQSPKAGSVASLVAEMTGMERVAFFTTGSEAVMVAIRLARAVTNRPKIVLFVNSYHGSFDGVLAVGWADNGRVTTMPITDGTPQHMVDDVIVLRYGDSAALDVIRAHTGELAAVLVEPVQSRDPAVQPAAFLHELRALTAERDIALIFDEMITGFRIHPGGAQHYFGITADLATYGKIAGGGLPIGVVAGKKRFMDAVDGGSWQYGDDSAPSARTAFVAGTFNNHPLTMAAAEAMLRHLKDAGPALQEELNSRTAALVADLNAIFEAEEVPIRTVHFGSLFRFDFASDSEILNYHLLKNGVFVWEGRNCFLSTAHSDADIGFIVDAVRRSVAEMRAGGWLAPLGHSGRSIEPIPTSTPLPLARGQQEMWFLLQTKHEATLAYNEMVALELRGRLDVAALQGALDRLLARHDALRSTALDGETWRVAPPAAVPLPIHEVVDDGAVSAWLAADLATPFDLVAGPPLRAALLRRDEQHQVLVLTVHHIVADGWSLGLIVAELSALYAAERNGTPAVLPPAQAFSAFIAWSMGLSTPPLTQTQLPALTTFPPVLLPRVDATTITPSFSGGRIHRRDPASLSGPLYPRIKALAQAQDVSPVMVLLAAYALLLGRLADQQQLTIGLPVAGHIESGLTQMVGQASAVLPLALTLNPEESFAALLQRVRADLTTAQKDVRRLFCRQPDGPTPTITALFNIDRGVQMRFEGLEIDWISPPVSHPKMEIFLNVLELNGQALFDLDVDAAVATPDSAGRWFESLLALVDAATSAPQTALRDLPLSPADRAAQDMVTEWRTVDSFGVAAAIGTIAAVEQRGPSGWIPTGQLGRLQPNGNVDLLGTSDAASLRASAAERRHGREIVAPRTPAEARIAAVWAEVLGLPEVGVTENFFELGGQSLKALTILSRIGQLFGSALPLRHFFETPTVAGLARLLAEGETVTAIARLPDAPDYAPSNAQARLWMLEQIDPGLTAYNIGFALVSKKTVNETALRHALTRLAERHESLRTALVERDGLPRQAIQATLTPALTVETIADAAEARGRARDFTARPFDLARAPLWRVALLKTGDSDWIATVLHHAIGDVWSIGVFVGDLLAFYQEKCGGAPADLTPLPIHYRDYAAWQEQRLDVHLPFWQQQLANAPATLDLPSDRPRPALKTYDGEQVSVSIPASAAAALRELAARRGASPFMAVTAGLYALLHHITGRQDLLIGSVQAGREHPALSNAIGFFVNTLPLRTRVLPNESFTELLDRVRATMLDAVEHGDTPFDRIVEVVGAPRHPARNPLFDIVLVMDDRDDIRRLLDGSGIGAEEIDTATAQFDLTLYVTDHPEGIAIKAAFNTMLFDRARIERLLADFASLLSTAACAPDCPLSTLAAPTDKEEPSPHQKRLWFVDRFERGVLYPQGPTYYNMPLVLQLDSAPDRERLAAALQQLSARHPALRSALITEGDRPRLHLEPHGDLPLTFFTAPSGGGLAAVEKASQISFDLSHAPLAHATLCVEDCGAAFLALTAHHAVADKHSLYRLLDELATLYKTPAAQLPALPPAPAIPVDCREADSAYWRAALFGLTALVLPTDRPRPAIHTYRAKRTTLSLDSTLAEAATALAEQLNASGSPVNLTDVLRAAWLGLLYRVSGQTDIVIGEPLEPGAITAVGANTNLLCLRADLDSAPDFAALVVQSAARWHAGKAHGDTPFDQIVLAIKPKNDMSRTALFDVLFHHDRSAAAADCFSHIGRIVDTGLGWGKYDLVLSLHGSREGGLDATLVHNRDLFDDTSAALLLQRFRQLLSAALATPTTTLADLNLMLAGERAALLKRARTVAEYPRRLTLHAAFETVAAQHAASIAITDDEQELSYDTVNRWANRLAHALRALGVGPDTRVGVCLDRQAALPVACLGILKAGGAYLPLDPEYPADRLRFMADDSDVCVIITDAAQMDTVATFGRTLVHIDDLAGEAEDNLVHLATPDNLAYIIYTSGSTGQPKGVMIEHRNVIQLLFHEESPYAFGPDEVWTLFHSPCFDFSVWEMYGALLHGGRLVIVPRLVAPDADAFVDLLVRQRVTVLNQTPTAFYNLIDAALARPTLALSLRQVIFGGEALQPAKLADWHRRYPATRLINMYGITETTVHVTFKSIGAAEIADGRSIIGPPLPSYGILLLDSALRPLPVGIPGELCVSGHGVARGYLNRPELSAERFIAHPELPGQRLYRSGDLARLTANGELIYLGRLDQQVKIRGFRIELGEIERQLLAHPAIHSAVVLPNVAEAGNEVSSDSLSAYLVTEPGTELSRAAIIQHVSDKLPDYMLPSRFVRVDAIPLTANGKIDRDALAAIKEQGLTDNAANEQAHTSTQRAIAAIWCEVLGIERVGLSDNFFDLGGHSLKANQVVVRIRNRLERPMNLKDFFSAQTLAALATLIDSRTAETAARITPASPPADPADGYPLSFAQRRLCLLQAMEPDSVAYNMVGGFTLSGPLRLDALARALAALVARHEVLRSRFITRHGEPRQVIDPAPAVFTLEVEDHRADTTNSVIEATLQAELRHVFDLGKGHLLRVHLIELAPTPDGTPHHALMVNMHHVVSDGWSVTVLLRDLEALYRAALDSPELSGAALLATSALVPLPIQYKDYATWQVAQSGGSTITAARRFWLQQFEDSVPALTLPTDRPRPERSSGGGAIVRAQFDEALTDGLHTLARAHETTLFVLLAALVRTHLHLLSGDSDIVLGTPTAGRDQVELEGLIGFHLNLLALRVQAEPGLPFTALLAAERAMALDAFAHQSYSFDRLVEELALPRLPGRQALFDAILIVQNNEPLRLDLAGVQAQPIRDLSVSAKYDLNYMFEDLQAIDLALEYATDLFDPATAERFAAQVVLLAKAVVATPNATLVTLGDQAGMATPAAPLFVNSTDSSDDQLMDAW